MIHERRCPNIKIHDNIYDTNIGSSYEISLVYLQSSAKSQ